jgi:hypothetical protein
VETEFTPIIWEATSKHKNQDMQDSLLVWHCYGMNILSRDVIKSSANVFQGFAQ